MTASADDERLRAAFRALAAETSEQCSGDDLEKAWRAVSGELPAEERRGLVERAAGDPAYAEAWRIAYEVQRSQSETAPEALPARARSWNATWLSLAAALVLVIGVALIQVQRPPADTFRDQGGPATVASLVPSDAVLPRDAFKLRWTAGPEGSRYTVRVTTEDLRVLATAEALASSEFVVPAESLSGLGKGSRVFWQVVMSLPNGESLASDTFVVRIQ